MDGIISSTDCPFVVTLTQKKKKDKSSSTDLVQYLMIDLNETFVKLSNHENYSFGIMFNTVLETVEEYKNCSDYEATALEIYDDEDVGSISDDKGYFTTPREGYSMIASVVSTPNQPMLKIPYSRQRVEDANGTCDRSRLMVMSARFDMPY